MTSMAGPTTRKLTRTPRGFSIYVLGGSKDGQSQAVRGDDYYGEDTSDNGARQATQDDQSSKLSRPRSHEREPLPYPDDGATMSSYGYPSDSFSGRATSTSPHDRAVPASSYPFPAPGTTYGTSTYPTSSSYPSSYPYGTVNSPFGAPYPAHDTLPSMTRPALRRGEPYDDIFEPEYSGDEDDSYPYGVPGFSRSRRPSLSRRGSSYGDQSISRPPTRRNSDSWDVPEARPRYSERPPPPRPQAIRDSSALRGEFAPGTRDSALLQQDFSPMYHYPNRDNSASPMSDFGGPFGSPGSSASSDSDFSMPRTPPQLAPLQIPHINTPGSRSVRWDENLIAPSPIFPVRRKGWFCRRGDQLWTNGGAYRPPKVGEEYPPDLVEYPDFGEGWMNEEGVRIDMQHCLVPKMPLRSALKRRES